MKLKLKFKSMAVTVLENTQNVSLSFAMKAMSAGQKSLT